LFLTTFDLQKVFLCRTGNTKFSKNW